MKLSKNTLTSAAIAIVVALGCVSISDTTTVTEATTSNVEFAKADLSSMTTLGGIKEDIIILKPE